MPRSEILSPQNEYLRCDLLTLLYEFELIDPSKKQIEIISLHNGINSFSEEIGSLLWEGKYADASLIVGKGVKEFHVHKAILAARSQVFAAMFEHDCDEKRQNKVIITDMDEDVCGEMLSFVYSGKVKSMEKYAIELLEAADMYQMDSMKNLCEQYMSSSLSIETAANVLIVADLYRANGLKSKCIEYMVGHAKEVMQTKGWNELAKT